MTVRVLVRKGAGMRLRLITRAGEVTTLDLEENEQVVEATAAIGQRHGYVRAEVRAKEGRVLPVPQFDLEAFTSPVRLVVGDPPAGIVLELAPPPPATR